MKHLRNYLTLLVVALLGTLTFIACDKDDDTGANSIVGTWTWIDPDVEPITIEMTFKADKTFTQSYKEGSYSGADSGTYRTDKNKLILTYETGSNMNHVFTFKYSIDGDKLTMHLVAVDGDAVDGDAVDIETYVFTRKK